MRTITVATPYQSEFPEPIRVAAGERVAVEDRPTSWVGWVFCTTSAGREGWVPSAFLHRDSSPPLGTAGSTGTMLRDYDATELTVAVGERLEVIEEVAGWVRCRTSGGTIGWIPAENVELVK